MTLQYWAWALLVGAVAGAWVSARRDVARCLAKGTAPTVKPKVALTVPAEWTEEDIEHLTRTWEAAASQVAREGGTLTVLVEPYTARQLQAHRFSYEGATSALARHLVDTHALAEETVQDYDGGLTQGHWIALDDLHVAAHAEPQELHRTGGDPT